MTKYNFFEEYPYINKRLNFVLASSIIRRVDEFQYKKKISELYGTMLILCNDYNIMKKWNGRENKF